MGDEPEKKSANGTIEFLKSARDIAFLFAVFLYFMGWIYIYYFLDSFGLSVKAMDVDIYNLLIYSSNVFIYLYHNQMLVVIFILLAIVLVRIFHKNLRFIYFLYPFFIVGLFPVTFYYARLAGEDSASKVLDNPKKSLKQITFVFKDLKSEPANQKKITEKDSLVKYNNEERLSIMNQSKGGSFRLLVANKEEYYLLQVTGHYDKASPAIKVVKKDMIEYATISN